MKWFEAIRDFWMSLLSSPGHREKQDVMPVQEESKVEEPCPTPKATVTYPSLFKARHGKYSNEEWWRVIGGCKSIHELHVVTDILEYCIEDYTKNQIVQYTNLILRRARVLEQT